MIRDQEFLLPPNMADWLPADHLVWFVIDVVDQLDTARFHARRRRGGVGRQGYDPDMLLGLLLYSYAVGERSSRRIEKLCVDHVAFRVLCGQDAPDHTTIARFRAEHEDDFADVFTQVLRLCAAAGMVKVGIVSIDGSKIAANASRGANRKPDAVREEARRIAEDIVAEAGQVDAEEDAEEDATEAATAASRADGDLPSGFGERGGRAANIKKALAELDRQDAVHEVIDEADRVEIAEQLARLEAGEPFKGQVRAGADPVVWQETKIRGLWKRHGELAGIKGREASTKRAQLRVRITQAEKTLARFVEEAAARGEAPVDLRGRARRRRERRDERLRARGGSGASVNVTDPDSRLMVAGSGGGSVQGYNAQIAVTDDHLILGIYLSQDHNDTRCYLPTLQAAMASAVFLGVEIGTVLADAGYFTHENLSTEGPFRLIAPGKNRDVTTAARDTATTGAPPPGASVEDTMRHLLRDPVHAETYKRRSATVETLFAHIKEPVGLRRFARRGLTAVKSELYLAAAVVNIRRLYATIPNAI